MNGYWNKGVHNKFIEGSKEFLHNLLILQPELTFYTLGLLYYVILVKDEEILKKYVHAIGEIRKEFLTKHGEDMKKIMAQREGKDNEESWKND